MTSDQMLSEDIVQDVYLKFYEAMDHVEHPEFWIYKTARNEVYQYYRKKNIHKDQFNVEDVEELEIQSEESLVKNIENEDLKILLKELISLLPLEQREVFLLKEYAELSYKEISTVLEIDEELVKSRLHKARQKLIKKISKLIN
jgi:RNA polymerase sigma-70 factor, ECF subfamily